MSNEELTKAIENLQKQLDENSKAAKEAEERAKQMKHDDEETRRILADAFKSDKEKNGNRKSFMRGFAISLAAVVVLGAGHHLVKDAMNVKIVKGNKNVTISTNSEDEFNKKVAEFRLANPTVDEETARAIVGYAYQEELKETNPNLLFDTTGIYDYVAIKEDDITSLTAKLITDLGKAGITINTTDAIKLVTILNIDSLVTDCPEFITKVMGEQTYAEFVTDAFNVTSVIKSKNHDIYNAEHSTTNLIKLSNYIFNKKDQKDLQKIESYVDLSIANNGNADEQNRIVASLLNEIYAPNGSLSSIEEGVGFGSTIAFDLLINSTTRTNDNEILLTQENLDLLLKHDELELYLSNIKGYLENPSCGKSLTK